MTVVNVQVQLLQTHGQQVHDIAYVQVEDPVVLLVSLDPEDGLHVGLQGLAAAVLLVVPARAVISGLI